MIFSELNQLHADEAGASYSLSLVLIIPITIAYVAFIIECILLMNSSMALTAAVQTAGHAVKAWTLHRDTLEANEEELQDVVVHCVARNMMPYATTKTSDGVKADAVLSNGLIAAGMKKLASERYASKLAFIERSLRVEMTSEQRQTPGWLIKIEYDSPIWTQVLAPVFGTSKGGSSSYYTLKAQTWVPLPGNEFELKSMGIPFSPKAARHWSE